MHHKQKLGNNQGMLFPMEKQINSMWMKNTYIPLDIIFLDIKKAVYKPLTKPEHPRGISYASMSLFKPNLFCNTQAVAGRTKSLV